MNNLQSSFLSDPPDIIPKLTDVMLLSLSKQIPTDSDVWTLGLQGLKLKGCMIQRHLTNYKHDITDAAYHMLVQWRHSQTDDHVAYRNICYALVDANMHNLINVLK